MRSALNRLNNPRMPDEIPPVDPDLLSETDQSRKAREALEHELLERELVLFDIKRRAVSQRQTIKWIAIVAGVVVMLGMALVLWHLSHNAFWGPFLLVSPAFSVAMVVAPIASITAITVALFVGAFRRFEDRDMEAMGNGLSSAASLLRNQ